MKGWKFSKKQLKENFPELNEELKFQIEKLTE